MAVTIRSRRRVVNKLLSRSELLLEVFHEGKANVSHKDLKELIASKYKADIKNIILFGFRTAFGGGRSRGFCYIYENPQYLLKYEPNYRLRRLEILPKKNPTRKTKKELKKKIKKSRAGDRNKILSQKKMETKADVRKAKEEYLKKLVA